MTWIVLAYFYATGSLLALLCADLMGGDWRNSSLRFVAFVIGWPVLIPIFFVAAFIEEARK